MLIKWLQQLFVDTFFPPTNPHTSTLWDLQRPSETSLSECGMLSGGHCPRNTEAPIYYSFCFLPPSFTLVQQEVSSPIHNDPLSFFNIKTGFYNWTPARPLKAFTAPKEWIQRDAGAVSPWLLWRCDRLCETTLISAPFSLNGDWGSSFVTSCVFMRIPCY